MYWKARQSIVSTRNLGQRHLSTDAFLPICLLQATKSGPEHGNAQLGDHWDDETKTLDSFYLANEIPQPRMPLSHVTLSPVHNAIHAVVLLHSESGSPLQWRLVIRREPVSQTVVLYDG